MVELTVQVPDSVAERLGPMHEHLPDLLAQIARTLTPDMTLVSLSLQMNQSASLSPAYAEVLDFLVNRPTPQEILDFKVSAGTPSELVGKKIVKRN